MFFEAGIISDISDEELYELARRIYLMSSNRYWLNDTTPYTKAIAIITKRIIDECVETVVKCDNDLEM